MTSGDLISGLSLIVSRFDELKGPDRVIINDLLDASLPDVFATIGDLIISSVEEEEPQKYSDNLWLTEDGCEFIKGALDLCYDETFGTCRRGGIEEVMRDLEAYCDENCLCGKCFGGLHNDDFRTCVDIEEYQGAMVSRVTETGYVCPHCGFREEW